MKCFRTAAAVAALACGWLAGCNDYNNSIQYNTGPQIRSISPTGVVAGDGQFMLTVQGNAWVNNSVIQWNGKRLNTCTGTNTVLCTTFTDQTTITTMIPADYVANPAANLVNVLTPQSGTGNNGLSQTITFYTYSTTPNPVPTVTSIAPTSAAACGTSCSNSTSITITGTNFLPTSNNGGTTVAFQDLLTKNAPAGLTISSLTATTIQASIPGTYLANNDTALIWVINPANIPGAVDGQPCPDATCVKLAGGGTSNQVCFTIGQGAAAGCPIAAQETPAISQDGRYVAYVTQQNQIFLRDTCAGLANGCTPSSRALSVAADGTPGNAESHTPVMTPDGRYIAFSSAATNLVEGAPTGRQIYLRDTCLGTENSCKPGTILVSTDASGELNGTQSYLPSISASGRFVAFVAVTASDAARSGSGVSAESSPNSGLRQVFLRDTCLGVPSCTPKTTRISLMPGDAPETGGKPVGPAISGEAKHIALNDRKSATVFAPTVPVDDSVYVALPKDQ